MLVNGTIPFNPIIEVDDMKILKSEAINFEADKDLSNL